ncbi:MAG: glutathione S-transferase family protein [Woeseiaceae bacterium]|nr:glutathione S-transferase family protein [Woeseiaceae bacterium]
MAEVTIYGDSISGNCYKPKLAAAQTGFDYRWVEVDLMAGETRTPEFLAMNPNGKVPLMDLGDGRYLPESNAMLWYIAEGSALVGTDRFARAGVLSWMFFEQYSHEPFIATSRFIVRYLGNPPDKQQSLEAKKAGGYRALNVMEKHLETHAYFANDAYSIADIALFAYTHVAHEGGFDLSSYPAVNEWLERVRSTDGFVPMTQ